MVALTDGGMQKLAEVGATTAKIAKPGLCEIAHVSTPVLDDLKGRDGDSIISCSIRLAPRNELARIYDDCPKDDAAFLLFFDRFERAFVPLVERCGKVCRIAKELPNPIVIFPAVEPFNEDHGAPLPDADARTIRR